MKFTAGSLESSDCLITIAPSEDLVINIESVVFEQFGDDILRVISETLKLHKITKLNVLCQDKGALDYTIKSRLETAIKRMGEQS
ncbi:MAG: citrate lyase acyl carrier protein [Firmicutes bacterium]|nr:citrate lyase acyl carrier protein [Bacillota bacterium]